MALKVRDSRFGDILALNMEGGFIVYATDGDRSADESQSALDNKRYRSGGFGFLIIILRVILCTCFVYIFIARHVEGGFLWSYCMHVFIMLLSELIYMCVWY